MKIRNILMCTLLAPTFAFAQAIGTGGTDGIGYKILAAKELAIQAVESVSVADFKHDVSRDDVVDFYSQYRDAMITELKNCKISVRSANEVVARVRGKIVERKATTGFTLGAEILISEERNTGTSLEELTSILIHEVGHHMGPSGTHDENEDTPVEETHLLLNRLAFSVLKVARAKSEDFAMRLQSGKKISRPYGTTEAFNVNGVVCKHNGTKYLNQKFFKKIKKNGFDLSTPAMIAFNFRDRLLTRKHEFEYYDLVMDQTSEQIMLKQISNSKGDEQIGWVVKRNDNTSFIAVEDFEMGERVLNFDKNTGILKFTQSLSWAVASELDLRAGTLKDPVTHQQLPDSTDIYGPRHVFNEASYICGNGTARAQERDSTEGRCSMKRPVNATSEMIEILKDKFTLTTSDEYRYSIESKVRTFNGRSSDVSVGNSMAEVTLSLKDKSRVVAEIRKTGAEGLFGGDAVKKATLKTIRDLPNCLRGEL